METPKFKISGKKRRIVKTRLSFLKSYLKTFWWDHQMEKDMSSFYGGTVMSDEDAQIKYNEAADEISAIEKKLQEHE
jgi:hypothetical protein